jgi:hypothetical protein
MAGLDPAIQSHTQVYKAWPWMATSEGCHDVEKKYLYCANVMGTTLGAEWQCQRLALHLAVRGAWYLFDEHDLARDLVSSKAFRGEGFDR